MNANHKLYRRPFVLNRINDLLETLHKSPNRINVKGLCLILIIGLSLLPTKALSSLRLEEGSYANPTIIDTLRTRANLNFTYHGCDPNPKPENIRLSTDGDCKLARSYELGQDGEAKSLSGTIGEMLVSYKGDKKDCSQKYTRTLHTNLSLEDAYKKFESKGCYPTHLVIRDNETKNSGAVWRTRKQKGLCSLPDTKVSKKGFPTEDHDFFNLSANEDGFKVGDHTHYRYNHNSKEWCVRYRENPYKCGQFPSPLPMAYKNTGTGNVYVKGVVALNPNGEASIYAIDKSYPNLRAMFQDQRDGNFKKVNRQKGRIDFRTWQKDNGVPRSIISSYEYDPENPTGRHQRSLNFFPRNTFGVGITRSWCDEEHCFLGMKNINDIIKSKCKGKTGESRRECEFEIGRIRCNNDKKIELTQGGSGNSCHSCLGITPGVCAINTPEVDIVKKNLVETDELKIDSHGEYIMRPGVENGLAANYTRIAEKPKRKGCFDGYARDSLDIFDSGSPLVRSAQSVEERKISIHPSQQTANTDPKNSPETLEKITQPQNETPKKEPTQKINLEITLPTPEIY